MISFFLFLHDMLCEAGIVDPPRTPGRWAATSAMWKKYKQANFKIVHTQERGDVVSDGKHCGICIGGGRMISATDNKITIGTLSEPITVQRYNKVEDKVEYSRYTPSCV